MFALFLNETLSRQKLGAMCAFFDSLKDTQAVCQVHLHLYIDPTGMSPIFGSLLESILGSGCTELHASSHSASGGLIHIPRMTQLFPSTLTSLNISSPMFFFPHSIRFTLSVLQSAPLAILWLNNTGLSPLQWAVLLGKVNLPSLVELEVDQTCLYDALATCLIVHRAISKLTISHCGFPTMSVEDITPRSVLHSLRKLAGPATRILPLLKVITLPSDFQCLYITFHPYHPERNQNVFSDILLCVEYLPCLSHLEISMPMITSTDELAAFVTFPITDKRVIPVRDLTFRGIHPILSTPDVFDAIGHCGPWLRAFPNVCVLRIASGRPLPLDRYKAIFCPFTQQNVEITIIPHQY
ncbi:hypothetical protein M404DRAFT_135136 [Pisolithus tinctorius Marx 270]|uniref:F-box domain-containing protein n=1 Tax=Pisolithus tinctorius Marx 270 TaxID=870435 RepID=A0A0C3KEN7_PISTI|nr:hypothetical protein M404DRAFT_135136 [Pisolithus tinctorius Marx 270]